MSLQLLQVYIPTRPRIRSVTEELNKLEKLREESLVRKIADFEYEKGCIAEIIENIDEARVQFEVCVRTVLLVTTITSLVVAGCWCQIVQDAV